MTCAKPDMQRHLSTVAALILVAAFVKLQAAKLVEVGAVDRDYLVVHFLDGEVTHRDNGLGPGAFTSAHELGQDTVKLYNPALDTGAATTAANWTLVSAQDADYSGAGRQPTACYRKCKVNGHAEGEWSGSDYQYQYTREHFIYLRLPVSMDQGASYTLTIAAGTNTDVTSRTFTYDIYQSRSEAVHVNLVGYHPQPAAKAADLYIWMGDGGARNYSSFVGNQVYLYDVNSRQSQAVGTVAFWKASGQDVGWFNLTRSDVWNADFPSFSTPGTYRLAIQGVGCSQDFDIRDDIYFEPFRVSVKGYFYMRIGQDSTGGIRPVPRRPLYIPGIDPPGCTVYLTTMHPWHAQWTTFSGGDVYDNPDAWKAFRVGGNPTNPRARGGHADAADWDRNIGHIANIYDMLLPFVLTDGAINDDNLGIAESGNGVPDVLDEARNEVDFWLHLRDGAGYGSGLTNPNSASELFQAAPTAMAAWANAANAAMLADCFRIAGLAALMQEYRDSAAVAYAYAGALTDQMLDQKLGSGETYLRGRDLKLLAAVYLYNVTGDTLYERVINQESVCTSPTAMLDDYGEGNTHNQVWAVAGYLKTPRTVHFPALLANMKSSIIAEAKRRETDNAATRPSRRGTDVQTGYFRTAQYMDRTLIAHAVTTDASEKALFRKVMVQEADWGLGRNPLNMIQMTTATTALASKRSVLDAYTAGRNDGSPGMHPGHTPYMNLDDWACGMTMGCPSQLHSRCYPANFTSTWPIDEGYFSTRYVWAHVEFTPQQTMRGKMALYGYLYGLGAKNSAVGERPYGAPDAGVRAHCRVSLAGHRVFVSADGMYEVQVSDLSGRVVWQSTQRIRSKGLDLGPAFQQGGLRIVHVKGMGAETAFPLLGL
jgi:hypothetical protein